MTVDRGPIEIATASPGFNLFWNRLMTDLSELHAKLVAEAERLIREGSANQSSATLLRAVQTRDIIDRIKDAPVKARTREKENLHGRPDESRQAGYSDNV